MRETGEGSTVASAGPAAVAAEGPARVVHLLTFDVEEYFQVESASTTIGAAAWHQWPRRLQRPVERILELLAGRGVRATFFVLGWVARHESELVRLIADAGHEVASHGMTHAMVTQLTASQFRDELETSRKVLQDLTGQAVLGYRAPTFSIMHGTAWALEELCRAGYQYDSSVFTVHHDRYGVPEAPPRPHMARWCGVGGDGEASGGGGSILEIPPLTLPIGGVQLPLGGGGYMRLLPARVMGMAIGRSQRAGLPAMIYMHPWEIDAGQPVMPMSRLRRWRHRVGLGGAERKLDWLLGNYRFAAVADCLASLRGMAAGCEFVYGRGD